MNIGKNISTIRKALGIKQNSLMQGLGLSRYAVSKIESSKIVADDLLEKIASILGVNPQVIKQFNGEKFPEYLKDNKICSQTGSGFEYPYDFSDLIEKMKIEKKSLEERLIKNAISL